MQSTLDAFVGQLCQLGGKMATQLICLFGCNRRSMEPRQNLEFLQIQYRALLKVGLDMGCVSDKGFIKNRWKFIYQAIITSYVQYCLILYSVNMFKVQIDNAPVALSISNQCCLIIVKLVVLMLKSDKMLKLIWDMNLLATKANPSEQKVWASENRRAVVISKVYAGAVWAAVIFSVTIPIITMTYEYLQGFEIHQKLPFDGQFPYEDQGSHIFILNYILSLMYVYSLLNLTVCLDTLFGWFVHTVSAHFRILRMKVASAAKKIEISDNHDDLLQDIGCIVQYHIKLMEFVDELNDIFGAIFFAEVMFSCLQLCFVIYSLNNDAHIYALPFNATVFIAVTIQMMIYCFGGEKLKTENSMLYDDICAKFPWEKMFPSERKLMMLPLMLAQKQVSLVGLFFEMDRNLLVYIYRTAFSFNTLLGTI